MKKVAVIYTVAIGIAWEIAYSLVIIGVGLFFSLASGFLR